ncbi:MAG: aminotransferase class I/II-fold pyridoxal phosphate-dependent enzyme [Clostridium sp.]|nr:aminotransferase class I/II-fold pyridoxal phosphate-dependent enzyme [Clostridium sp.]
MKEIHGGDVYRNHVKMDFSVNINPLGPPESVKKALHKAVADCNRYPDIMQEQLKKAVGAMLNVPEEALLFGNGASELLMACAQGIKPKRTVIPVPSFYGYEYAAEAAGGEIIYYKTRSEEGFCPGEDFFETLTKGTELVFLANPGNPSGKIISREYLKRLLSYCRERGIFVILDECFIEFCTGNNSMLEEVRQFENLLLVRAFTKIFAIPGVRLGYLICSNGPLLEKIGRQLPEWNLSCFAQAAGQVCAVEKAYLNKTADYVAGERKFLTDGLKRRGIAVVSGEANFLLVYSSEELYEKLLSKGILIRDCGNFRGLSKGFYRIAVKSRKENEALLGALGGISWKE